jgi:SAM-dependent methyltransferase
MKSLKDITLRRIVRKITHSTYMVLRNPFMIHDGLHPKATYVYSTSGHNWESGSLPSVIRLPNLSTYYHPVLRGFWESYGLGDRCLLVSESNKVKEVVKDIYPHTSFVTTDYFTELQPGRPDVAWDVCFPAPKALADDAFSSIISNALLEHLVDATSAFANMLALLRPKGYLFALTHTPSFPLHRYPRDYVRFHHDYFEDLPKYLAGRYDLSVDLKELWSRRGQVIVCYQRI